MVTHNNTPLPLLPPKCPSFSDDVFCLLTQVVNSQQVTRERRPADARARPAASQHSPTLKLQDDNKTSVTRGNRRRPCAYSMIILSVFYGVAQHRTWLGPKHTRMMFLERCFGTLEPVLRFSFMALFAIGALRDGKDWVKACVTQDTESDIMRGFLNPSLSAHTFLLWLGYKKK